MIKPSDPRQLAIDLMPRSICAVQVGACITDASGRIISWGWNFEGWNGLGEHAESHAIKRSNRDRLWYGAIYVASQRRRNGKAITSRPCPACQKLLDKYRMRMMWRDHDGRWQSE